MSLEPVFLHTYQNMVIFFRKIQKKLLGCKFHGPTKFMCTSLSNPPILFQKEAQEAICGQKVVIFLHRVILGESLKKWSIH